MVRNGSISEIGGTWYSLVQVDSAWYSNREDESINCCHSHYCHNQLEKMKHARNLFGKYLCNQKACVGKALTRER